jgi:hypothetical protein
MSKLEEGVASAIGADGAHVGIPGFATGSVKVGGTTIALRADRPPIFVSSGGVNMASGNQTLIAPVLFPFKTILVGLRGILSITVGTGLDGTIKFGNDTSATAYLSRAITAGTTISTTFDFMADVTGYDSSTNTGISIAANTRVSFGTGTTCSTGTITLLGVFVPHL